jgi:hypothetical protein
MDNAERECRIGCGGNLLNENRSGKEKWFQVTR